MFELRLKNSFRSIFELGSMRTRASIIDPMYLRFENFQL